MTLIYTGTLPDGTVSDPATETVYQFQRGIPLEVPARLGNALLDSSEDWTEQTPKE